MKALFKAFAVVLAATIAGIGWAQITVNSSNFPGVGATYISYSTGQVTVNLGSGGANQTWDFTSYDFTEEGMATIVSPGSTPFSATFPNATHAFALMDSVTGYYFSRLTSTASQGLGYAGEAGGVPVSIVYNPASTDVVFPLTYQTAWTSVSAYTFEPIPGFTITYRDSIVNTCDGWGTLIAEDGSWQVLRVKEHNFSIVHIPPLQPTVTEDYSYSFITNDGFNGAQVISMEANPRPDFTEAMISATLNTLSAEPVRGPIADRFHVSQNYPNPFNPSTTLPIEMSKTGKVTIDIYNEMGQLISSETRVVPMGAFNLPINGSAWSSGNYFARVAAEGQTETVKMQLVK
ncbi:MAG: T9SS type A sorting domain-containing protein [Calditrichota bacterium]